MCKFYFSGSIPEEEEALNDVSCKLEGFSECVAVTQEESWKWTGNSCV